MNRVAAALTPPRVSILPIDLKAINSMMFVKFLTLELETACADPKTVRDHAAEGLKLYPALKHFQKLYLDIPAPVCVVFGFGHEAGSTNTFCVRSHDGPHRARVGGVRWATWPQWVGGRMEAPPRELRRRTVAHAVRAGVSLAIAPKNSRLGQEGDRA